MWGHGAGSVPAPSRSPGSLLIPGDEGVEAGTPCPGAAWCSPPLPAAALQRAARYGAKRSCTKPGVILHPCWTRSRGASLYRHKTNCRALRGAPANPSHPGTAPRAGRAAVTLIPPALPGTAAAPLPTESQPRKALAEMTVQSLDAAWSEQGEAAGMSPASGPAHIQQKYCRSPAARQGNQR